MLQQTSITVIHPMMNALFRFRFILFLLVLSVVMAGCATDMHPNTLFERIGGLPVLNQVVDDTVENSVKDPRTQRAFKDIKLKTLKESIVSQLCVLSHGPCVYEGVSMADAHKDLKINDTEFDAFVEIFRESLNRHVNTSEKNELLKLVAPMKRDIVRYE